MTLRRAHFYVLYGLASVGILGLAVLASLVDPPLQAALICEGGPVEALSAAGYFICAVVLLRNQSDRECLKSAALLLVVLGLRELDFHSSLTTESITRTRLYLTADVHVLEKVFGGGILLVLIGLAAQLAMRHLRGQVRGLRRGEPAAVGLVLGLSFIVVAKTLDGLSRKLTSVGVERTNGLVNVAEIAEETLELGIPLVFLIGIVAHQTLRVGRGDGGLPSTESA